MSAGGPRFDPAPTDELAPRVRRIEDWAGRHDQWSHQVAREASEKSDDQESRLGKLEGQVTKLYASIGEHKLKWGIVAWVLGVAVAVGIAWVGAR